MKRILRGVVGVSALLIAAPLSAANAADMPLKAPPPPACTWCGFYIGGNIGGGWGSVRSDYNAEFDPDLALLSSSASGSQSMSGIIGGAQAGYNWQRGNWVFGWETDFQLSSQHSSSVVSMPVALILDPAAFTDVHSVRLPWFGTVRGRIGFTPANRWLVYATGGLAYGYIEESNTLSSPFLPTASHSLTKGGWTLGGGIEAALWSNWTARLEYLYIDLGDFNDTAVSSDTSFVPSSAATISSHLTDNVVRVGLNYYFH